MQLSQFIDHGGSITTNETINRQIPIDITDFDPQELINIIDHDDQLPHDKSWGLVIAMLLLNLVD